MKLIYQSQDKVLNVVRDVVYFTTGHLQVIYTMYDILERKLTA